MHFNLYEQMIWIYQNLKTELKNNAEILYDRQKYKNMNVSLNKSLIKITIINENLFLVYLKNKFNAQDKKMYRFIDKADVVDNIIDLYLKEIL